MFKSKDGLTQNIEREINMGDNIQNIIIKKKIISSKKKNKNKQKNKSKHNNSFSIRMNTPKISSNYIQIENPYEITKIYNTNENIISKKTRNKINFNSMYMTRHSNKKEIESCEIKLTNIGSLKKQNNSNNNIYDNSSETKLKKFNLNSNTSQTKTTTAFLSNSKSCTNINSYSNNNNIFDNSSENNYSLLNNKNKFNLSSYETNPFESSIIVSNNNNTENIRDQFFATVTNKNMNNIFMDRSIKTESIMNQTSVIQEKKIKINKGILEKIKKDIMTNRSIPIFKKKQSKHYSSKSQENIVNDKNIYIKANNKSYLSKKMPMKNKYRIANIRKIQKWWKKYLYRTFIEKKIVTIQKNYRCFIFRKKFKEKHNRKEANRLMFLIENLKSKKFDQYLKSDNNNCNYCMSKIIFLQYKIKDFLKQLNNVSIKKNECVYLKKYLFQKNNFNFSIESKKIPYSLVIDNNVKNFNIYDDGNNKNKAIKQKNNIYKLCSIYNFGYNNKNTNSFIKKPLINNNYKNITYNNYNYISKKRRNTYISKIKLIQKKIKIFTLALSNNFCIKKPLINIRSSYMSKRNKNPKHILIIPENENAVRADTVEEKEFISANVTLFSFDNSKYIITYEEISKLKKFFEKIILYRFISYCKLINFRKNSLNFIKSLSCILKKNIIKHIFLKIKSKFFLRKYLSHEENILDDDDENINTINTKHINSYSKISLITNIKNKDSSELYHKREEELVLTIYNYLTKEKNISNISIKLIKERLKKDRITNINFNANDIIIYINNLSNDIINNKICEFCFCKEGEHCDECCSCHNNLTNRQNVSIYRKKMNKIIQDMIKKKVKNIAKISNINSRATDSNEDVKRKGNNTIENNNFIFINNKGSNRMIKDSDVQRYDTENSKSELDHK